MQYRQCIWCVAGFIAAFSQIGAAQTPGSEIKERILRRSLLAEGDTTRLENVFIKAMRGEPVVIGFIGGSITEGAAAGPLHNQYGSLVVDWFKSAFPQTPFTYVNAGLGASSSNMGAHRIRDNLLNHNPDLVVCEYAVNDNGNERVPETMEGLVRQILKAETDPAVILLFMCDKNGKNAQNQHIPVGRHYDLPMVSFRDSVYLEVEAGHIKWEDIETDTVHPNAQGHRYCADILIHCLQSVKSKMSDKPTLQKPDRLPIPLTKNRFEFTTMVSTKNGFSAVNQDWSTEDTHGPYARFLGNGWLSTKPGSHLIFDIRGAFISLVYHLDKQDDYGIIRVQVDDREPITLDAYAGWIWNGGMCAWKPIADDLNYGWHTVRVTLVDKENKDRTRNKFRVMAVMGAGQG